MMEEGPGDEKVYSGVNLMIPMEVISGSSTLDDT